MEARRVVTGFDADGKPAILADSAAPVVFGSKAIPEYQIAEICVIDNVPTALDAVDVSGRPWGLEPPGAGVVCRIVTRPPESSGRDDLETLLDEVGAGDGRSGNGAGEAERPGQHQTATIDIIIILSGVLWLTVGGQEVRLGPGDSVVQGGVPHAWHNRGTEACVMVGVMIPVLPAS
ncbi:MAG TPA: cupin domain-containing protein [Acidimicrobiales bacterium]